MRKEATLCQEYEKNTGRGAGTFETLPYMPNKIFFYDSEYVKWLERRLRKARRQLGILPRPKRSIANVN